MRRALKTLPWLILIQPPSFYTIAMTILPQKAIVLIDPVTEWKQLVQAAAKKQNDDENTQYQIIAIQMAGIELNDKIKQFLPTSKCLKEYGVDHVISMNRRDVYSCAHELKILEQQEKLTIRGVIPLSEIAVDVSDMLAASLGLPHNPLDLGLSRRDKGFMKDAVARIGLRVAKFARVGGNCDDDGSEPSMMGDLQRTMARLDLVFPVVIKTPQGFSTTDVYTCKSTTEAENALNAIVGRIGPDGRAVKQALLEEYIGGTEFAVNIMVFQDYGLYVTDVWKYEKDHRARYGSAEICNPNDPALCDIILYAKNVARAVGVQFGAAHVELKAKSLHDENKYVDPVMIEIGARLSGGQKASMAKAAVQEWDPFTALIESHCGQRFTRDSFDFTPQLFVRHIFLPIERAGRIQAIEQVNPSELKTLYSSSMIAHVGDVVSKTTDITSCAGFVWLVGERSLVDIETVQVLSEFKLVIDEISP